MAYHFGYVEPDAMLAAMAPETWAVWQRWAQLEPRGDRRADYQIALLAAVIANGQRTTKSRGRPAAPKDFLPDYGNPLHRPPRRRQTAAERSAGMEAFWRGQGARDLRRK
jgi:hypothetical protein